MSDAMHLSNLIPDALPELRRVFVAAADASIARVENRDLSLEAQQAAAEKQRLDAEGADRELRWRRLQESGVRTTVDDRLAIVRKSLDATTRAMELVRRWVTRIQQHERDPKTANAPPRILVLAGGVGCGKTVAAAWALAELGGRAVHSTELAQRIDPWQHEEQRYAYVPLNTRFVVLDDLGAEAGGTRFEEALGRFIDARQGRGWTLITSNLIPSQIAERYGERVRERIDHSGVVAEIAANSMRKRGRLADSMTNPVATEVVPIRRTA